jgi:hypothetical protein
MTLQQKSQFEVWFSLFMNDPPFELNYTEDTDGSPMDGSQPGLRFSFHRTTFIHSSHSLHRNVGSDNLCQRHYGLLNNIDQMRMEANTQA